MATEVKVGDIVFAKLKDTLWPAKVKAVGAKSNKSSIKFVKVNAYDRVSTDRLIPFTPENIARELEKNNDKVFVNAIKAASIEVKRKFEEAEP